MLGDSARSVVWVGHLRAPLSDDLFEILAIVRPAAAKQTVAGPFSRGTTEKRPIPAHLFMSPGYRILVVGTRAIRTRAGIIKI